MPNRSRAVVGLVLVGLLSGGCFTYAPIAFDAVQPKDDVRLRVTDDAAARLSKDLGVFSTEIDGEMSRQGRDSVALGISIDRSYKGMTVGTSTQTLLLGRSEVVEVRKRQFSKQRTAIFSAATVVGFGALVAGIAQLVDPNGPNDGQTSNPPPPQLRRPPRTHFGVRIPIP